MKLKHLFLTAVILTFAITANAQNHPFQWVSQIGSDNEDQGNSIAVDGLGNTYIAGYFKDTIDADPGSGIFTLESAGFEDIFITKLDVNGDFLWAKIMGGTAWEVANSIALDGSGNIYTTGYFAGACDFDPNSGIYNLVGIGSADIFVSKLDPNGNFMWAKRLGGSSTDVGNSIAVDAIGNVFTTGSFFGTADFDPGIDTFAVTAVNNFDIFIHKLDFNGDFAWVKTMGSGASEEGNDITLDVTGNIYVTGYFSLTIDFDPGVATVNLVSAGNTDGFALKLDVNGNFVWAKKMGGTSVDHGNSITTDASGNVYTTGYFNGTASINGASLTSAGGNDIFISKFTSSGNMNWARRIGGTSGEDGRSILVDALGNVYTTGFFSGTSDFDPGNGISNLISAGDDDIFVSKLSSNGSFVWAKQMGGTIEDRGYSIALDTFGNLYTTGYFGNTVDFDPDNGVFNLTSFGNDDIFVQKLGQVIVSVEQINASSNNINVYPNPASNNIEIESSNSIQNIMIVDINGRVVYNKTVGTNKTSIDTSTFSNGIYMLGIKEENEKNIKTVRVVIQK